MQTIKCALVGDEEAKISHLLISYTTDKFPAEHVAAVRAFGNYRVTVKVEEESYTLDLFDTAGQEDYDRLRPLSYPMTDIFLVCFSVVSPSTFINVSKKWVPEITHHCPDTPFLIVGTHIDLRDDPATTEKMMKNNQIPITKKEGEKVAKKLGAVKYAECSAKTTIGMKNVFDEAILFALEKRGINVKSCRLKEGLKQLKISILRTLHGQQPQHADIANADLRYDESATGAPSRILDTSDQASISQ